MPRNGPWRMRTTMLAGIARKGARRVFPRNDCCGIAEKFMVGPRYFITFSATKGGDRNNLFHAHSHQHVHGVDAALGVRYFNEKPCRNAGAQQLPKQEANAADETMGYR